MYQSIFGQEELELGFWAEEVMTVIGFFSS